MTHSRTLRRARARQVSRYLAGVVVVSVGATFGIRSGAGAAPYDALLVTLTDRFGTPFWATAWLVQVVWIAAILRAGGRIRLGALFHSLLFGPIITVALVVIPEASGWVASSLYLAAAVAGIAVGLWLYLGAAFVSGMVDTLFDTLAGRGDFRTSGIRTVFDLACCAYAWIGGGPVGIGTVVIAFGVGPLLGAIPNTVLHPSSWRGIRLGASKRSLAEPIELVDTAEYSLFGHPPSS